MLLTVLLLIILTSNILLSICILLHVSNQTFLNKNVNRLFASVPCDFIVLILFIKI